MTDEEMYDLATLAEAEINAICQGVRKWTMSVPVRETDSDVLFGQLVAKVRELEADKRRLEEQLRDAYDPIRKVERRLEAEANNWDVLPCGHRGYVVLIEGTDGRYCKSICDECGADVHPEITAENGPSRE